MTGPLFDDPPEGLPTTRYGGVQRVLRDLAGLLLVIVGVLVVLLALGLIDSRLLLLAGGLLLVGGGIWLGRDRDEVS